VFGRSAPLIKTPAAREPTRSVAKLYAPSSTEKSLRRNMLRSSFHSSPSGSAIDPSGAAFAVVTCLLAAAVVTVGCCAPVGLLPRKAQDNEGPAAVHE
jgi:hypothetical protein